MENDDYEVVLMPSNLATRIEEIVKLTPKNYDGVIGGAGAWKIVDKVVQLWANAYPEEYQKLSEVQKERKSLLQNAYAVNEEKGGAITRHHLELPKRVYDMLLRIFPNQDWNKEFVTEFGKKYQLFYVPNKE